jgi:hypothetical protein
MSKNHYDLEGQLVALNIEISKTGKEYANGIIVLRDEAGRFESSHPFYSFDAVAELRVLKLQYFSKSSAKPETSGGDLAFDDSVAESKETGERTVAKPARPEVVLSGKFKSSEYKKNWKTTFMVESVN